VKYDTVDTASFSFTSIWSSSQNTDIGYFDGDAITRLRTIFTNVCKDFEAQLIEMDGEDNHVHLLVNYPPKHSISALVNSLKGVSSRLLRRERPDLNTPLLEGCSLVAFVFRCQLWRRTNRYFEGVHRAAKDTTVTEAYIPALKGEVLRPHG
jgi:REP element-mobilizing transposase RayT